MCNLLLLALLLGDVNVAMENRLHNGTGMQCVFASLETIGRHHGYDQLYGLCDEYKGMSNPYEVAHILQQRQVPYEYKSPLNYQTGDIKRFTDEGRPCLIGLYGNHAVVCIGLDDESARIISNNRPSRPVQTIPIDEFSRIFDRWVFALVPQDVDKTPPMVVKQKRMPPKDPKANRVSVKSPYRLLYP